MILHFNVSVSRSHISITLIQLTMMMNLLALCLVVTSLAAAGVWSPSPASQTKHHQDDDDHDSTVIVRDGHRVVVVEYDENGQHNTKVSISSDDQDRVSSASAKERFKEASSVLPNLGQGLSYSDPEPQRHDTDEDDGHRSRSPGELICDAYGKFKHRIANAYGIAKHKTEDLQEEADEFSTDAKDAVGDAVHQAENAAKDRAYDPKDAVGNAVHRTKDAAKDKAYGAKDAAKDRTYEAKDAVNDAVHKAKDAAKDRAYDAKEAVGEAVHKAKDAAKDRAYNAKEAVGDAVDKAKGGAQYVKQGAVSTGKTVGEKVISNATIISEKAGQWMQGEKLNNIMSIVNMLGFATAFGMSVWISFISSSLLASSMPKHQFGMVQSKVYPAYFKAMGCSIGAALLGHLLGQRKRLMNPAEMYQAWNLLVSLLLVNINLFIIEPRATKVMFERMKLEKEEGRGEGETQTPAITRAVEAQPVIDQAVTAATACSSVPERAEDDIIRARADGLNSKLKRFNSCSSLLNLFTFIGLNWHLVYLSQRLHSC